MFKPQHRFALAVLAVSLALATPLHGAPSRDSAPDRASRTSPASPRLPGVWHWLTALWAKVGCSLDPGGLCAPAAPPASSNADEGCSLDPGGRTCAGHS